MNDIEQLKLILEVVGDTTESAKWVLLSWFAADLLKVAVCWVGGVLILSKVTAAAVRACSMCTFGAACRDVALPNVAGTSITESEKTRTLEIVRLGWQAKQAGWKPND